MVTKDDEDKVELSNGDTILLSADWVQSSAPIRYAYARFNGEEVDEDDIEWKGTPYQVADASHDVREAAELIIDFLYDRAPKILSVS